MVAKRRDLKATTFLVLGQFPPPPPPTSFLQSLLFYLLTIIYRNTNTSNDNESQRVVQQVTTSDNDLSFQLIFLFFRIREEPTTKHPKETPLNLEEDLQKRLLN